MYKIVTSLRIALLCLLIFSNQLLAIGVNAEKHVEMSAEAFIFKGENILSITLKHDKGWHTYWKNPGDAGLPSKFKFSINNQNIELSPYPWPKPKRYIEAGNILAFGYADTQHFFFKLNPKNNLQLSSGKFRINGQWLVCKDICIPGEDRVELTFGDKLLAKTSNQVTHIKTLVTSFKALPKNSISPKNLEIFLTRAKEDNKLVLQYTFSSIDINNFDMDSNLLTPYLTEIFDYKHEKLFLDKENKTLYGKIYIDWNGIYEDPEEPLPKNGIFTEPIRTKFLLQFNKNSPPLIIDHLFKEFSPKGDESLNNFLDKFIPINQLQKESEKENSQDSILHYILLAFLGGLILNLMPCVLPVISLKLFGLIAHSDESKKSILKHNLSYTFGILTTFMTLAAVITFLKSTGEKIGWGFQLQSPSFVFTMMLILIVMSMNMLGLFEFMTPGGKTLGNADLKKGFLGDFLNGVLATILSTPCSAPFLGAALTFAFTKGTSGIFLIFFFVGLGLAFPFILTGIFPKAVSFLPRPGIWMDKLKNILGFTLLLTFVWLYDVFMNIIDFNYFGIYFNTIFTTLFMAFFFRKHITKIFIWNLIFFSIPIALIISTISSNGLNVSTKEISSNQSSLLTWSKWSKSEMGLISTQKRWVFVDFTAKWCLTCKVNKKLVLQTEAFEKVVKEHDIKLLIADWTKRDDHITDFLNEYKIVGVPAYFMQSPAGKIIHLGETISIAKIRETISKN